jgi:parallel beta-helix repeat protein
MPWQTVRHAFDTARPGQTVCLRAGVYLITASSGYNQTLKNSGTPGARTTFTNYPGEVAIIHGNTRVQAAYTTFRGTPTNGRAGLVFEGPTGQHLGLIDVMYSHDVTFDQVEIRNADYHAGLYQYGGYNIKLIDSYIHDNGRPGYIKVDQGIYWDATTGGGNLIANNLVEHNVSNGIQLYPSPSEVAVQGNTVVNNGNYGIVVYGSKNRIVNNIFADNGSAAGNPQMRIYSGTDHVIDSNIFWSSLSSLRTYINLVGQTVTHAIIADPLFVNPAAHDYHLRSDSPAICVGSPPDLGAYEHAP